MYTSLSLTSDAYRDLPRLLSVSMSGQATGNMKHCNACYMYTFANVSYMNVWRDLS